MCISLFPVESLRDLKRLMKGMNSILGYLVSDEVKAQVNLWSQTCFYTERVSEMDASSCSEQYFWI